MIVRVWCPFCCGKGRFSNGCECRECQGSGQFKAITWSEEYERERAEWLRVRFGDGLANNVRSGPGPAAGSGYAGATGSGNKETT